MFSGISNYIVGNIPQNPEVIGTASNQPNKSSLFNLPSEVIKYSLNILDIDLLMVLNLINKEFNLLTSKNERFIEGNEIYRIANKIIIDSQPFIKLVEWQQGANQMETLVKCEQAEAKCRGIKKIEVGQNSQVLISFTAFNRFIPVKSLKSYVLPTSWTDGYFCMYTSRAQIKDIISEDKKVEKAVSIAQQGIDKLIKQNESNAKSLYK